METNNEKFSLSGKTNPISSRSDYFGNTNKSNGNDLYKVLLLSVLFVIAIVLIYNTCKNNTPASPISINENDGKKDTPIISQPEIPVTVPVKDTIVLVKKDKKRVRVSASDLEGLRRKLLSSSISALRSGNYTPANLRVNLNTFSASFDLDPVPSDFIKLSLVWGPLNVGCESCVNSLQKNPGSVQMFSAQDNTYEYGIIAIAN